MKTAYGIVLVVMSIVVFILYVVDKKYAESKHARIPEVVLIVFTALGGTVGAIIGMIAFNHKSNMSRKWHFFFTLVVAIIVQLVLAIIIF